jgi:hypothetical protein
MVMVLHAATRRDMVLMVKGIRMCGILYGEINHNGQLIHVSWERDCLTKRSQEAYSVSETRWITF